MGLKLAADLPQLEADYEYWVKKVEAINWETVSWQTTVDGRVISWQA